MRFHNGNPLVATRTGQLHGCTMSGCSLGAIDLTHGNPDPGAAIEEILSRSRQTALEKMTPAERAAYEEKQREEQLRWIKMGTEMRPVAPSRPSDESAGNDFWSQLRNCPTKTCPSPTVTFGEDARHQIQQEAIRSAQAAQAARAAQQKAVTPTTSSNWKTLVPIGIGILGVLYGLSKG